MGGEVRKNENTIIVCRCRDVTLDDVIRAIEEYNITDLETLKRKLGLGMGPCQGRTCIPLVIRILARKVKKSPDELMIPRIRAPIIPVQINLLLKSVDLKKQERG